MTKPLAVLWLVVVLLAGVHVAWVAAHGLPLDSDLMSLLPQETQDPAVRLAKDRMTETMSRRLVVMVGHPQRETARTQAAALRRTLAAQGLIRPEHQIADADSIRRLGAAYFPHRAGLLADSDRKRLAADDGQALVTRALSQVYGVGGPVDSTLLGHDPLLLFPAFLAALPGPDNRLTIDDGMPTVHDDGLTWVLDVMVLDGEPYALDVQTRLRTAFDEVAAEAPAGTRWLRLGAVFYAQAGADQGMRESARIGLVSLAGIVLSVLIVFRSAQPLLLSLLAVAVGLVTALSACLALFGALHVAAQLFGATLIGVAVDYALHYFGQVFHPGVVTRDRLPKIASGLFLGAATSMIGYAMLALSPFPGLKQAAVFSTVGLAGSLATVALWFPLLDRVPARPLPRPAAAAARALCRFWDQPRLRPARWSLLAALAGAVVVGATAIKADDDLRRQQGLSPVLAAEQAEIQRLSGLAMNSQFFLVEGADEQQVLEREEALGERLAGLAGWQSTARYVPSHRRQAENARLVDEMLYARHLDSYRTRLGMEAAPPPVPAPHPLSLADIRATAALPILDSLAVSDLVHAVVLDTVDDMTALAQAAQGLEGVRLIDPTADLGELLRLYRLRALALLAASVAAFVPLLVWRYGWGGALRVAAPPLAAVVATPPLLALAGIGVSFFGIMGLLLVLSIGTDYALFCAEDPDRDPATVFSVGLATLTTLLSFGLLAASDLGGVRAFGATMLVGGSLAFLLAPGVSARPRRFAGRSAGRP
jgi:predicted exporter